MDILVPDILREPSKPLTAVKNICIVGAGPSGLACLQVITETPEYNSGLWRPIVFESRDKVGGVWNPAPPTTNPPSTPLYDSLTTNLPHPIMRFSSFPFPPSTPIYPAAVVVQSYLEEFVSHFDLAKHIRLGTTIQKIDRDPSNSQWQVCLSTDHEIMFFDYIVVANGHYNVPRFPNVPGLDKWLTSGKASHSAWYRGPRDLGDTILVVGSGPSGLDIVEEMRSVTQNVFISISGSKPLDLNPNIKTRSRVVEFLPHGKVVFEDGTFEENIDHCILATGFEISFPFFSDSIIKRLLPPPIPPLPSHIYNSTYHVFPLMKHLFPLQARYPPTSLAFLGFLFHIVPFPLVEAQARVMVKVWSHPQTLDLTQEAISIVTRYEHFRQRHGENELEIAKTFSRFDSMEQFDYTDDMYEFAHDDDLEDIETEKRKVPAWHREVYANRDILRREWKGMERSGEAEQFVRGVGSGGPHEWEGVMMRLLARALDNQGKVRFKL